MDFREDLVAQRNRTRIILKKLGGIRGPIPLLLMNEPMQTNVDPIIERQREIFLKALEKP